MHWKCFLKIVLRGNGPKKLQHVPLCNDEICFKMYAKSQDIREQVIENAEPIALKGGISLTSHVIVMAAVSCWYFCSM